MPDEDRSIFEIVQLDIPETCKLLGTGILERLSRGNRRITHREIGIDRQVSFICVADGTDQCEEESLCHECKRLEGVW